MVNDVKARGLSVEYLDANLAAPFIKLKGSVIFWEHIQYIWRIFSKYCRI